MKWLITGGCGFIGTCLVREVASKGNNGVRVLDNLSVGSIEHLEAATVAKRLEADEVDSPPIDGTVELVVADILDAESVLKCSQGIESVVHLAAVTGVRESLSSPIAGAEQNVIGTLNCLEGARQAGAKRFIFASSGAAVGECDPPIHELVPPSPVSPYGASKLAGEGYCSAYYGSFGLETVALRFGNVYGPGSFHKGSVVAKFIRRALAGEILEVYGDGAQTRDFIFIDDLVEAITSSVTAPGVGGQVFQIATGTELSVNEITEALLDALAEAGMRNVSVKHGPRRSGDVERNYSDTSKARRMLGWRPQTTLKQGLAFTVRWFLEQQSARAVGF
jgi:UDP-glucose 4-epimerase